MAAEIPPSAWEDREKSISVNLGEALRSTSLIDEAIKARLLDPHLTPKSKAGLRQILRTAHRLQRTLKKI